MIHLLFAIDQGLEQHAKLTCVCKVYQESLCHGCFERRKWTLGCYGKVLRLHNDIVNNVGITWPVS